MTEPRVALVTTTINVPEVLRLYHAHDSNVAIFVAGDTKTPEPRVADLVNQLGPDAHYLSVETQKSLGYACSELIGWSCIQRRNIATLEALKWGADILVSIDDDNIPLNSGYFGNFIGALSYPYDGIKVSAFSGWFDVGQLLDPIAPHRGFPHNRSPIWRADPVVGARVGVAAGICLGDPDIGAVERIANHPTVHRTSHLLDAGIVVDPNTWTVFNSQNTAFIRELAPAMFMMPKIGRYDDIFASLICQRVMRERGLHVRFGQPFVWQERNQHDLLKDLRAEMLGMEHILAFSEALNVHEFPTNLSVIDQLRHVFACDTCTHVLPLSSVHAMRAWLDDIEKLMGSGGAAK